VTNADSKTDSSVTNPSNFVSAAKSPEGEEVADDWETNADEDDEEEEGDGKLR